MGKTKWTPVIEDEIAHPLFFILKEIIIIIIIIPEIIFLLFYLTQKSQNQRSLPTGKSKSQKFSVIGFAFLLLARQSLYKYKSVLARSSVPFYFRFFRYKTILFNLKLI